VSAGPRQGYPVHPVTVATYIPANADTVFAFVADTRNDPVWCPNVTDVTQTAGEGVEKGSAFRFRQAVETPGRTLQSEVDIEIVEIGDRSIRWRVEDKFQLRDIVVGVTPDGTGSRVTQTTEAAFKRRPGIAKWFYPLLARRTFRDQFSRLERHFSSGG